MPEFITALTQASSLIEKGGIIGVLLIVIGVLSFEVIRLRKTLVITYNQRDKARLISSKYKSVLDSKQIVVDISDITLMFSEPEH